MNKIKFLLVCLAFASCTARHIPTVGVVQPTIDPYQPKGKCNTIGGIVYHRLVYHTAMGCIGHKKCNTCQCEVCGATWKCD